MTKVNVIKVAVVAAGGNAAVAKEFGVTNAAVQRWYDRGVVPSANVRRLCEMGGNLIKSDDVLAYIEAAKACKARALETVAG